MTTRWTGHAPSVCDLCGTPIVDVFYDASIPTHSGTWGCIDHRCFIGQKCSLGVGLGQKYVKASDGSFVCTEGGRNTPNIVPIPDEG